MDRRTEGAKNRGEKGRKSSTRGGNGNTETVKTAHCTTEQELPPSLNTAGYSHRIHTNTHTQ